MTIDAIRAAEIYGEIAKIGAAAPQAESAGDAAKPNFSELVKTALAETQNALETGEAAAAAAAKGEASLVDVVTAVSAAEVSLEAAIVVRNRVIEAYQDILRMPI